MSKQVEDESTAKEIARLNQELRAKERELKGWKGRASRLGRQVEEKKSESSPTESEPSPIKPIEAPKPEFVRPYEKYCPDCGGPNPNYVAPNLFCNEKKGGCGVPLGHVEQTDIVKDADGKLGIPKFKLCWNCGSTEARMIQAK